VPAREKGTHARHAQIMKQAQDENARGHKTFWHSCMYEAIALAKGLGFSCYNSRTLFLASLAFCRERDVPVAQDENVRGYNDILAQLHV
jgi:hypothetical protein